MARRAVRLSHTTKKEILTIVVHHDIIFRPRYRVAYSGSQPTEVGAILLFDGVVKDCSMYGLFS
jgi:hypothetical protein